MEGFGPIADDELPLQNESSKGWCWLHFVYADSPDIQVPEESFRCELFRNSSTFEYQNWYSPDKKNSWKSLWTHLQRIQRDLNMGIQFYNQIQSVVWISILFLMADAAFFCYPISVGPIWFWDTPWLYPVFVIGLNLSRLIVSTVLTLFYVLVFSNSKLFTVLNRRAELLAISYNKSNDEYRNFIFISQLEKWRNHNFLVCQLSCWINNCFGEIILVTLFYFQLFWTI